MTKIKQLNRIAEIIKNIKTCMMVTIDNENKITSRPMHTVHFDGKGNLWFFTDRNSGKMEELENNQPILLTYADVENNTYLSISGYTIIEKSQEKKNELFSPIVRAWFPDGPESSKLTLLRFQSETAELWDGSDNKIFQLYKIGKALLTNQQYETAEDSYAEVKFQ